MQPPDDAAAAAAAASLRAGEIEAWTYLAIGILFTALRTYGRIRKVGTKYLQGDDYLVWVAAIFYIAETVASHSVATIAHGMANNNMSDEERVALSPDDPEYQQRTIGSKIQLIGWCTYSVLLWALKGSLLFFYVRLMAGLTYNYRIRIYVGFALVVVSWLVLILVIFLECRPFYRNWQIFPDPGNACQPAVSVLLILLSLVLNVVTDIYLISIPVPMLWHSTIALPKKLGLIALFSGGIFVICCSILRSTLMIKDPANGAQTAGSWSVRETFIATITTNLPATFPLFKSWFRSASDTYSSKWKSRSRSDRGIGTADAPVPLYNQSREHMIPNIHLQTLEGRSDKHVQIPDRDYSNGIWKDVEINISSQNSTNRNAHNRRGGKGEAAGHPGSSGGIGRTMEQPNLT